MTFASEVIAGTHAPVPSGYWRLGETSGTTAVDAMGLHNGTYIQPGLQMGETGSITGDSDTSFEYTGTGSQKVAVAGLSIPSSGYSVMAAVMLHGTPPTTYHAGICSLALDATQRQLWVARKNTDGNVSGYWDNTNTGWALSGEVLALTPTWHLMHLVVSGTNVKQYRAGVERSSSTITAPADTYDDLYIGGTAADTNPMKGWIDEFVIWDDVLTAQQVTDLYDSWVSNGNVNPVANAGSDQTNIEPYTTVTLDGSATDSDGTISSLVWTQTGGSPSVTLSNSGNDPCTFEAPGTIAGTTLTFTLTATDDDSATDTDTMTTAVLSATERAAIGGVLVPLKQMEA